MVFGSKQETKLVYLIIVLPEDLNLKGNMEQKKGIKMDRFMKCL